MQSYILYLCLVRWGAVSLWIQEDFHVRQAYSHDWTEDLRFMPEAVAFPPTTQAVSEIMAFCYREGIPMVAAGGRTGLSGGMLPVEGGLVISLEKLNRILSLDPLNLTARVQAGVITQHLQEEAEKYNLMYPPDPSSRGSCTIGGNIAHNAGGVRAIKYGTTREHVLALEVVLPDGTILHTGTPTWKNSTGYNLTQLFVGSEGTLGIITEATLKLLPRPRYIRTLLLGYDTAQEAIATVGKIFAAGILPTAIEFMEHEAVIFGERYLGITFSPWNEYGGLLLVELDGNHADGLQEEAALIEEIAYAQGCKNAVYAQTHQEREQVWALRRCLGVAVKSAGPYKEEDTVVPRAALPQLLQLVKEIAQRYGFRAICYGHVGDGNLHVNILRDQLPLTYWQEEVPKAVEEIFRFVVSLGGTLSGEHGIGWVQRRYVPIALSEENLALMKQIKNVFDPKGLLNPQKIFP